MSVDVSVTNAAGQPVHGLEIGDFEVLDNGEAQPLRYFGSATAPYSVYLLLDTSGSTGDQRPLMLEVVADFLASARPQDNVAAGTFGRETKTLVAWTDSREEATARVRAWAEDATAAGTTEFYSSLERVLERGFAGIDERRALIVLTDGRDVSLYQELQQNGRLLSTEADDAFQSISDTAARAGIPLYIVAINTDQNLDATAPGNEYTSLNRLFPGSDVGDKYLEQVRIRLEELASLTGGRVLVPRTAADVSPLFEQLARTLGQAYSLGWAPSRERAQTARTIDVRVTVPGYTVRQSRSAYIP